MSIENDVHQARFNNEYQKMNVNLVYTYNWVMEHSKRFYDKAELTPQQYNILRILRGASRPLSTTQLRQRMMDKMSDTSRIVDRLVRKNLVAKVICKADRRLVDTTITTQGLDLLSKLDPYTHELDSSLTNLSEDEAKTMNHLLDKLRRSV